MVRRQRQADLYEFEAGVIYRANSRTANATLRNPDSKNKKINNKNKNKMDYLWKQRGRQGVGMSSFSALNTTGFSGSRRFWVLDPLGRKWPLLNREGQTGEKDDNPGWVLPTSLSPPQTSAPPLPDTGIRPQLSKCIAISFTFK